MAPRKWPRPPKIYNLLIAILIAKYGTTRPMPISLLLKFKIKAFSQPFSAQ
jgi:hypothetical protein